MKLKVVIREAAEGGSWAEVPSIPRCATQGDTFEELLGNIYDAVEGCLSVAVRELPLSGTDRLIEIALRRPSPEKTSAGFSNREAGS